MTKRPVLIKEAILVNQAFETVDECLEQSGKLLVDNTGIWVTATSKFNNVALFDDCSSCTSYLVKLNKNNGRTIKGISYENCDSRLTNRVPTSWSRLCSNGKSWYRYSPAFEFVLHPSIRPQNHETKNSPTSVAHYLI